MRMNEVREHYDFYMDKVSKIITKELNYKIKKRKMKLSSRDLDSGRSNVKITKTFLLCINQFHFR